MGSPPSGMRQTGPTGRPKRRRGLHYDVRIFLFALVAGLPGYGVALILLWTGAFSLDLRLWATGFLALAWWWLTWSLRERVVRPLQTLSNLLAALLEGDYSIRSRLGDVPDDPLGLAMAEVNALARTLREQRLGALEATALLRKVMEETDVAMFTFDGDGVLRLVNRAGERLLATPAERLLGRSADELRLDACFQGEVPRAVELAFPAVVGRFEIRRSDFRQGGLPHTLLVLADLSRTLREEERKAWQRLVRVLGHEINNSLAPIKSIAQSLQALVQRHPSPPELQPHLADGLDVISGRAEALARFMASYARLTRLPPPDRTPVDVRAWVRRVATLEPRLAVAVHEGPDLTLLADGDQLDQLLINLVTNAADAALETGGGACVGWETDGRELVVTVEDEGPGIRDATNLFVPFFTTKPNGSGIGLVLSRQIAEAHGGTLALRERSGASGCAATLRLPLNRP